MSSIPFVAKHRETGLYQRKVGCNFMFGCRPWIKTKNPPFEEIRKEIEWMRNYMESNGAKVWTNDIADAEKWDNQSINEYSKYYPELEMVNIHLAI